MSKLKHVNLKNLIYLTGLKDSLVCSFASTLDCVLEGLESGNREQDTTFKNWRKGATFNRFTHHDVNFSFRIYQWQTAELKYASMCGVDRTLTKGQPGSPRRGAYIYYYLATPEGQEIISFPLVYVLREHGPIAGMHVVYEHGAVDYQLTGYELIKRWTIEATNNYKKIYVPLPHEPHGYNGLIYIGITSRSWSTRYREHVQKAKGGSHLPFHTAIRERFGNYNTRFHYVLLVASSKDLAEIAEEKYVEQRSLYPKGLNAIPGGKAGLKYLASVNFFQAGTKHFSSSAEEALTDMLSNSELVQSNEPLKLLTRTPNTDREVSGNGNIAHMNSFWADESNAARMITSRSDRLSIDQIRAARYSSSKGFSVTDIAEEVGARNVDVIKRLLEGKTYCRIS